MWTIDFEKYELGDALRDGESHHFQLDYEEIWWDCQKL